MIVPLIIFIFSFTSLTNVWIVTQAEPIKVTGNNVHLELPETIIRRTKRADERPSTVDCGVPPTPETLRKVGVAWHATIYNKKIYKQICAGSIVSSTVVISAAHCFWDEAQRKAEPSSQYAVAVGKRYRQWNNSLDEFAQNSDVREIIMASRFFGSSTNYASDIALVMLKRSIQFNQYVMPLCLDQSTDEVQLKPGALGKISGWGVAPVNHSRTDELKSIDLPYIDFSECLQRAPEHFTTLLSRDKMCAGLGNVTEVCKGDSGAGLAFLDSYRGRQRYYLRGILSVAPTFDDICGEVPVMAYTQISSHKDLVAKNVVVDYRLAINKDCGIPPRNRGKHHDGLPWHATIYRKMKSLKEDQNQTFGYIHICGGSLVGSDIVISAAHCFWDKKVNPASDYGVAVGNNNRQWKDPRDDTAQTSEVIDIKIGSRFNGHVTNYMDDIALVFLETEMQFNDYVRPVCVNFDQDFDRIQIATGNVGKMSGFGVKPENDNLSPVIHTVDVPVIGFDECFERAPDSFKEFLSTDKICAAAKNGTDTTVCKGDSGAGLSFLDTYRGQQRYYLRGVLSIAPLLSQGVCGPVAVTGFTWLLSHERLIANHVVDAPRGGNGEDGPTQSDCGTIPLNLNPLSIGGRPANHSEVPWHAGVYRKQLNELRNVVYEQICGGSLISKSLILSAAHCFANDEGKRKKPRRFAVAVGKLYREWDDPRESSYNVQKSNVSDIIIPDNFYGSVTRFQADVAIVKTSTPFQFRTHIVPVCLDFDFAFDNRQLRGGNFGMVAGWGYMNEEGVSSPVLKVVEEPIYNSSSCFHTVPTTSRELITTDKVCGGYVDGSQALCKGDSGGGLVVPSVEGGVVKHYLRGIVSTATVSIYKCNRFSLTYFTRVRAHQFLISEWLTIDTDQTTPPSVFWNEPEPLK